MLRLRFPVCTTMGLDWVGHPKHALDGCLPLNQCPDCEMLRFPLPFAGEIIQAMCSLAAETVGVRILSGESRSVGRPRSILYRMEGLWLQEQPELQRPRERGVASQAAEGTEDIVWHHGCRRASWVHHDGRSPVLLASLKNTGRQLQRQNISWKGIFHLLSKLLFIIVIFFFFFLLFGLALWHVRISVSQPGIKPTPPVLKMWSLNHRPPGKSSTTNYFKLRVIQLFYPCVKNANKRLPWWSNS